jgi:hypothetical protein
MPRFNWDEVPHYNDIPNYNEDPDDYEPWIIPPPPMGVRQGTDGIEMPRMARPDGYINYIQPTFDEPRIAFPYGTTRQKTIVNEVKIYCEQDMTESVQDWFSASLFEGQVKVANLYVQALTETTHIIARYDKRNAMDAKNPPYTINDLLPHVLEQYLDYPYVEHMIAEIYIHDDSPWRSQARYEEMGFSVMYADDMKIWMILNLL